MEAELARRRATAMRRLVIRARSRKEAEMELPDCGARKRCRTGNYYAALHPECKEAGVATETKTESEKDHPAGDM
jgi:hypothetical protein